MIFKTAAPFSPNVEIAIDKTPVNYLGLERISYESRENAHTLMVLDFAGIDPSLFGEYIDKPVYVSISYDNTKALKFNGYVVFLEPTSTTKDGLVNNSPFQITRAFCMGASYVMRSRKNNVWENKTIYEVAKEIADRYKFSVSVPKDEYRFPRLVQSGISDWALLVQTASQLGYSVIVENTHVNIWDPMDALGRTKEYAVLETLRRTNGNPTPRMGQILRFDGRIGAVTTTASRTPDSISFLDSDSNITTITGILDSETSGLVNSLASMFRDTLTLNADSYAMGSRIIKSKLRYKYPLSADVEITGTPIIYPGGIVKVDKYNSDLDGFWYVCSVRHDITKFDLVTTVHIVKDSLDGELVDVMPVTTVGTAPEAALVNGKWISEKDYVDVYA